MDRFFHQVGLAVKVANVLALSQGCVNASRRVKRWNPCTASTTTLNQRSLCDELYIKRAGCDAPLSFCLHTSSNRERRDDLFNLVVLNQQLAFLTIGTE